MTASTCEGTAHPPDEGREGPSVREALRLLIDALGHAARRLVRDARRARRIAAGRQELRTMDARMLRDIGVDRAEIERVARGWDPRR